MYAKRRFSRFPRRFVRTKRNGAWIGTVVTSATLTPGTASSWYLWDDLASQRLNLGGKGTHQRTLLWMMVDNASTSMPVGFGWHLNVYQTDAANNVPTSAIVSPWVQEVFEKSVFECGYRALQGTVIHSQQTIIERDVRVKRKLDDTDAVLLTVQANAIWGATAPAGVRFGFVARTYVSW